MTTRIVSPTTMNFDGSYSNTLTFAPLVASDAGTFMCTAILGNVTKTVSVAVTVEGINSIWG